MIKTLIVIIITLATINANTSNVTCISIGGGYYTCTNENGETWTVYQGD